jgi:hypothetical protein
MRKILRKLSGWPVPEIQTGYLLSMIPVYKVSSVILKAKTFVILGMGQKYQPKNSETIATQKRLAH